MRITAGASEKTTQFMVDPDNTEPEKQEDSIFLLDPPSRGLFYIGHMRPYLPTGRTISESIL
jgi:hypothetical protein